MNLAEDQRRYRVFMDASWAAEIEPGKERDKWRYYELRGPYGTLYPYSADQMALLVTSNIVAGRLRRARVWRIIQAGDDETVFLLGNGDWQEAAEIIGAKKKRIQSPEAAARLASWRFKRQATPPSPTPAAPDAPEGGKGVLVP